MNELLKQKAMLERIIERMKEERALAKVPSGWQIDNCLMIVHDELNKLNEQIATEEAAMLKQEEDFDAQHELWLKQQEEGYK